MTNCPNCSAPLPEGHIKCEYCGTTFIDFTAIDLQYHQPCYLRVKTDKGIITIKAVPRTASLEFHTDYADITSNGYTVRRFSTGESASLSMKFDCMHFKAPNTDKQVLFVVNQED